MNNISKKLIDEVFGENKIKIGKILKHKKYGKVIIVDGQYYGERGISNFWYWRKVNENKVPI